MRQHSALLQLQMVLALTLTLVLVLTLALAPSGMISKKGVPAFCPSNVVVAVVVVTLVVVDVHRHTHVRRNGQRHQEYQQ